MLKNIKEASGLCLECMEEEGWTLSHEYTIEQIEVAA